jgi:hypothetical protein
VGVSIDRHLGEENKKKDEKTEERKRLSKNEEIYNQKKWRQREKLGVNGKWKFNGRIKWKTGKRKAKSVHG